jgi:hypothetical protein
VEYFRDLFDVQSAKEFHFDNPAATLIDLGERDQDLVQRDELLRSVGNNQPLSQRHLLRITTPLLIAVLARGIDQNRGASVGPPSRRSAPRSCHLSG